jgi:uncharacterized repeat protein (TIGR01451 family)
MNPTVTERVKWLAIGAWVAFGIWSLGSASMAYGAADLKVTPTVGPLSPIGKLTYVSTVSNGGPAAATGVVLTQTLPAGVINVSVAVAPGSCAFSPPGDHVTCNLGTLAAGATATATITVHPITIGAKAGTAKVTSPDPDPNPANNIATASVTITEVAISDVAVSMADGPDPLRVGMSLVYSVTVRNIGDDNAQNVMLRDALPTGATFVGATASQGSCGLSGGVVLCSLGGFNVGGTATVRIVVRPSTPGIMYNTVGVALTTVDPNVANNSATIATWVNP